jgi:hypothetical protein
MTRGEIEGLMQSRLGDVADQLPKFAEQEVSGFLTIAYNAVMYALCLNAISNDDFSQLDQYTHAYPKVKIRFDQERDEFFSDIPAAIVHLPKNRGIRRISPMKDASSAFIPRDNGNEDMLVGLEGVNVDPRPRYYIEGKQVRYPRKFMVEEMAKAGVLMRLIIQFDEFDEDDELPLPAGKGIEIVQEVIQMLIGKSDPKKVEDNTPTSKEEQK